MLAEATAGLVAGGEVFVRATGGCHSHQQVRDNAVDGGAAHGGQGRHCHRLRVQGHGFPVDGAHPCQLQYQARGLAAEDVGELVPDLQCVRMGDPRTRDQGDGYDPVIETFNDLLDAGDQDAKVA